jgi:hypothetical protein
VRFLILWVALAHADSSVKPPAQAILLREVEAAKKFGDDFDPRKLDQHHLGLYVEVDRSFDEEWSAFLGEDDENCCEEPDSVKPPIWNHEVLRLQQIEGRALYACDKGGRRAPPTKANREVLIVDRKDGTLDVTLCGRKIKMVRSESYGARYDRWSKATAEKIAGELARNCKTVAVECDQDRLAAACPLPLNRTLLLERGHPPQILPPRKDWGEASQLEWVAAEIDPPPVWCVWKAGGQPPSKPESILQRK